jgi:hypothetical protein
VVVGVPVRLSEVVVLDAFAVTPVGSAPDAIVHLYGVQPPLALTTVEYAVPTVPLGSEVVVIATVPKHWVPSRSRREIREGFTAPCCRAYADSRQSQRFPDFCCLPPNCNEIRNILRKTRRFPDYRFVPCEAANGYTDVVGISGAVYFEETSVYSCLLSQLQNPEIGKRGNETSLAYSDFVSVLKVDIGILRHHFCQELRT